MKIALYYDTKSSNVNLRGVKEYNFPFNIETYLNYPEGEQLNFETISDLGRKVYVNFKIPAKNKQLGERGCLFIDCYHKTLPPEELHFLLLIKQILEKNEDMVFDSEFKIITD